MTSFPKLCKSVTAALCLVGGTQWTSPARAVEQPPALGWRSFDDGRLGLPFPYPADLFPVVSGDLGARWGVHEARRTGRMFETRDGRATLQVGAFENPAGLGTGQLRFRALRVSYKDARVHYDRLAPSWYVLSGTRDEEMFYERLTLSCGGRRIDVWSMTYPIEERDYFDRIVEELARRYRPALRRVRCN